MTALLWFMGLVLAIPAAVARAVRQRLVCSHAGATARPVYFHRPGLVAHRWHCEACGRNWTEIREARA